MYFALTAANTIFITVSILPLKLALPESHRAVPHRFPPPRWQNGRRSGHFLPSVSLAFHHSEPVHTAGLPRKNLRHRWYPQPCTLFLSPALLYSSSSEALRLFQG